MVFKDRTHAGLLLSEKLSAYKNTETVVFGLTRGGVEVAYQISKKLNLPLEAIVVKKIGSPLQKELAIGAVTQDNISFIDWKLALRVGADEAYIKSRQEDLSTEIKKLQQIYRANRQRQNINNKTVIVVDDGVATGATIKAVIKWLRKKGTKQIILAVPVAPSNFPNQIRLEVKEQIILDTPVNFAAVGEFYEHFAPVDDAKVIKLLNANSK